MTKFAVFENNKPAVIRDNKNGWDNHIFNIKREAEIYAYLWAYPVTQQIAQQEAHTMELDVQYNYSMYEEGQVLMSIKEVK